MDDNKDLQTDQTPSDSPLLTLEVNEEYEEAPEEAEATFDPQAFEATRNIINTQIQQIEEIKRQQKLFSEQLADLIQNNEVFLDAEKEAKEAKTKVSQIRSNIMESDTAKSLKAKIMDFRQDQKDLQESLSGHLLDLYQTTGVMEYESPEGDVYEYKIQAKLGAKKS